MNDEWIDNQEDFSLHEVKNDSKEDFMESVGSFEIDAEIFSDTFHLFSKKMEQRKSLNKRHKDFLNEVNLSAKRFILENIMVIDYRDLSKLTGIKPVIIKTALVMMGIKVPVEGARKWKEINVGTYASLEECSKCRIQTKHTTFFVGIMDCRKCYEKNIRYWVESGENININFDEN